MSPEPDGVARVDWLACSVTRVAGAVLVGLSLWQAVSDAESPWVWALCWSAVGVALVLLYTPALRVVSFGLVLLAGVVLIGSINPFAAMDLPKSTVEQPGFEFRHVARAVGASALLVLLAYCVSHARSVRLKRQAAR